MKSVMLPGSCGLSLSRRKSYVYRIRHYILFHQKRHPQEIKGGKDTRFPVASGGERACRSFDSEYGFCAVRFLYRDVLKSEILDVEEDCAVRPAARFRFKTTSATSRSGARPSVVAIRRDSRIISRAYHAFCAHGRAHVKQFRQS